MQALTFPQASDQKCYQLVQSLLENLFEYVQQWTSPYNRRAWANVSFSVNIEWLTTKHARGTTQTHSKWLCDKQRRKQKHSSVEVIIRQFCTPPPPPPLANVINDRRRRAMLIDKRSLSGFDSFGIECVSTISFCLQKNLLLPIECFVINVFIVVGEKSRKQDRNLATARLVAAPERAEPTKPFRRINNLLNQSLQ